MPGLLKDLNILMGFDVVGVVILHNFAQNLKKIQDMKHAMWSLVLGFVALCGMAGCGDDLVDDGEYYYVHNMNEFTITGQLTIYYTDVSGRGNGGL